MRTDVASWVVTLVMLAASAPAAPPTDGALKTANRLRAEEKARTKGLGGGSPMVIPAAAFATNGNYDDTIFIHPFEGYIRGKSGTDGCVQAPLYLPQGAEISEVYASILDNDAGANAFVALMRSDNTAYHDSDELAYMTSISASSSMQAVFDSTINHHIVRLPRYHYYIQTCLPSADIRLFSVRVYFNDSELFSDEFESGSMSAWN